MWWLETCACLFPSYTPSSHHTLHLSYTPLQLRNWELQREGEEEEEEEETKFPAQLQPHAQHRQEVGKPAENTQRESCDQQIGPSLENSLRRDQR